MSQPTTTPVISQEKASYNETWGHEEGTFTVTGPKGVYVRVSYSETPYGRNNGFLTMAEAKAKIEAIAAIL